MRGRGLLGACLVLAGLALGACTAGKPARGNFAAAASLSTEATGKSIVVQGSHAGVPATVPDASPGSVIPDRLPPIARLLADHSLVVMDMPTQGKLVIAVYDRQSSAKVATYPDINRYDVLDDEHILLVKNEQTDSERWTLCSPRLGTCDAVATLKAPPGSSPPRQILGVCGDELIYLEQFAADSDEYSLKLQTRSLRDLRPLRTLDLAKPVQAGPIPPTVELWKTGYVTITVDNGSFGARPLFVVDLHRLAVHRVGASVGYESAYAVGPRGVLAVMVKPDGPIHLFELAKQRRSRTIGLANAAKETGFHGLNGSCMSFDAEGNRIVVNGYDGPAWYDLRSNALIHSYRRDESTGDRIDGCEVGFTPSERYIFHADRHGSLRVVDASTGQLAFAYDLTERIEGPRVGQEIRYSTNARISPDRTSLVVMKDSGPTVLIDLEAGKTQPGPNQR